MDGKGFVERRKHKRFQVQENTFALLRAQVSKLGRVIDISKGGLAFRYVSIGERLKGPLELDLLSHHRDFDLNKIPVRIISNFEIVGKKPFTYRSITLRRVGVQFGELTQRQKSKLEYFIQNHAIGEAP